MMRGVWTHLKACEIGPSCSFRHCSSSQKILAHWKACRVMECRVCHIVRLKWAQMQVAKEAAATALASSSAKDKSSEESHLGESSGQSTTSLSQGYGQGQGRLPHSMTIQQGSSSGGGSVVDNQLINDDCGNGCNNESNQINYESNGNNATAVAEGTTGSSSFLEEVVENGRGGFHTCHKKSSTSFLQQPAFLYNQQVQQQLLLQQLQRSSRYHRPAYHKLMADLPSHLQFQSQHHRHSHNINVNHGNNNRQLQPVMRHYYDEQSVPPSVLMTMTLTRDDKSKRKIHDCLPCPSLNKVRICCGSGHSSCEFPQNFSSMKCKCRVSDGNFVLPRQDDGNDADRCFQHQRLHMNSIDNLEASAGTSFQYMIDETLGCGRVNVPNSDEQSAPSADDVRKAYERLGR